MQPYIGVRIDFWSQNMKERDHLGDIELDGPC
jgi:hypothetical protein